MGAQARITIRRYGQANIRTISPRAHCKSWDWSPAHLEKFIWIDSLHYTCQGRNRCSQPQGTEAVPRCFFCHQNCQDVAGHHVLVDAGSSPRIPPGSRVARQVMIEVRLNYLVAARCLTPTRKHSARRWQPCNLSAGHELEWCPGGDLNPHFLSENGF